MVNLQRILDWKEFKSMRGKVLNHIYVDSAWMNVRTREMHIMVQSPVNWFWRWLGYTPKVDVLIYHNQTWETVDGREPHAKFDLICIEAESLFLQQLFDQGGAA